MIVDFTIKNFLSFKDMNSISMQKAKIKSKYPHVDIQNIIETNKGSTLLKSKAIFGANGSGKSNLIKAFLEYRKIIENSLPNVKILDVVQPFALDTKCQKEPTFFQLIFINNHTIYRYGFEVLNDKIISEWLFGTPEKKEVYYFVRENDEVKINKNRFIEGKEITKGKKKLYRDNSLFLSVVAAFNGPISLEIIKYIGSIGIVWGLGDTSLTDFAIEKMSDEKYRKKMTELLKYSDMGIEGIEKKEMNATNVPKDLVNDFAPYQLDGRKPQRGSTLLMQT